MRWLIILLLLLPLVSAYNVDITLNSNDIVSEHFTISVPTDYESFDFYVANRPIGVEYQGTYSIEKDKVTFYNSGDTLDFTLIYSDMIEESGKGKTFRAIFDKAENITVRLPEKHILSKDPATIPDPTYITSDGERIFLNWDSTNSIAVFYEGDKTDLAAVVITALLFSVLISLILLHYSRKRVHDKIKELLSEDENLILKELKKGATKQKDIAKNLDFSKSKMSKVIRKLEEKRLIEKKPHFKTNIIKMKKI